MESPFKKKKKKKRPRPIRSAVRSLAHILRIHTIGAEPTSTFLPILTPHLDLGDMQKISDAPEYLDPFRNEGW